MLPSRRDSQMPLQVTKVVQRVLAVREDGGMSTCSPNPQKGRAHSHRLSDINGLDKARNRASAKVRFGSSVVTAQDANA